jgi:hypothetical protein
MAARALAIIVGVIGAFLRAKSDGSCPDFPWRGFGHNL